MTAHHLNHPHHHGRFHAPAPARWRALSSLKSADMPNPCAVLCDLHYDRAALPALLSLVEPSALPGIVIEEGTLSYRRACSSVVHQTHAADCISLRQGLDGMRGVDLHITKLRLPRALDYFKLAALADGQGLAQHVWLPLFAFDCEQKDEAHE